ncbi:MAG: tryptophan dimethylallyltransferase family protein [Rivularia sp. (in: cyanobacteria)]
MYAQQTALKTSTYLEYGSEKLRSLVNICGMKHKTLEIAEVFKQMTLSWGDNIIDKKPLWLSGIADDHTPFEFSVAIDSETPELRILCESQRDGYTLLSNWRAGMQFNYWLMDNYGASLTRLNQVSDLFFPEDDSAHFAMWHGACFLPNKKSEFKIYLNPQAKGKEEAQDVIKETFKRLGLKESWLAVEAVLKEQDPSKNQLKYFSLDLSAKPEARVKIYWQHDDIRVEELEKMYSVARNYVPGDITEFCQAIADTRVLSKRPVISHFSFIEDDASVPNAATFQLPVSSYAANNATIQKRVENYLTSKNLPVSIYDNSIKSVAGHSLNTKNGIHSYISFRRDKHKKPRVTIYLAV